MAARQFPNLFKKDLRFFLLRKIKPSVLDLLFVIFFALNFFETSLLLNIPSSVILFLLLRLDDLREEVEANLQVLSQLLGT